MMPFPILADSRSGIMPSESTALREEMPYLMIKYMMRAIKTPIPTHIIYLL